MTETSRGERRTNGNWFGTQEKSNKPARVSQTKIDRARESAVRKKGGRRGREREGEFGVQRTREEARRSRVEAASGTVANLFETAATISREDISPRLENNFNADAALIAVIRARLITTGGRRVNDSWQSNRAGRYTRTYSNQLLLLFNSRAKPFYECGPIIEQRSATSIEASSPVFSPLPAFIIFNYM